MKPVVSAVIQARMGSKRYPEKVLQPLEREPLLAHVVKRTRCIKKLDRIVLAIPDTSENEPLAAFGKKLGVEVVAGPEEDVLERYILAGTVAEADHVLRITSDNPLTDPHIADLILDHHIKTNSDYTILADSVPQGISSEATRLETLREIGMVTKKNRHREHVTTFFHEHPENYRISKIPAPHYLKNRSFRLTVDTVEDFALMEHLYGQFYKLDSIVDLKKVMPYLETHPEIAKLNSNIVQKDWRIE